MIFVSLAVMQGVQTIRTPSSVCQDDDLYRSGVEIEWRIVIY